MKRFFSSYLVKENALWKFYLRENEAKIMYATFYFTNNTYSVKAGRHSCTDKFEFFLVSWPDEISADFCTSRTHVQDLSTRVSVLEIYISHWWPITVTKVLNNFNIMELNIYTKFWLFLVV